MLANPTQTIGLEQRAWLLLRHYAESLSRKCVFQATTNGRLGAFGVLLPEDIDGSGDVYLYAWDHDRDQCLVTRLRQRDSVCLEDPLERHRWLRWGIQLLKLAASKVEVWRSGNDNLDLPSWLELRCTKKHCGMKLADHIQPGYLCPVVPAEVRELPPLSLMHQC